jgi:hypothetical protein
MQPMRFREIGFSHEVTTYFSTLAGAISPRFLLAGGRRY